MRRKLLKDPFICFYGETVICNTIIIPYFLGTWRRRRYSRSEGDEGNKTCSQEYNYDYYYYNILYYKKEITELQISEPYCEQNKLITQAR